MKIGFWILSTTVAIGLMTLSCRKEKTIDIDFAFRIEGTSPSAKVYLENRSGNFQDCQWEVSEGGDWQYYKGIEAPLLHVDKAGELKITLILRNLKEERRLVKTLDIGGHHAILHYQNICFAYNHLAHEHGRCFTSRLGYLYSDAEISVHTGAEIDLVFDAEIGSAYNLFMSPDQAHTINLWIPEAHATRFSRSHGVTHFDFDTIEDARGMNHFKAGNNVSALVDINNLPDVIGFEHSDGRRGFILCTERNHEGFIVDLKVEKYPPNDPS